jgi:hypothetical protein
LKRKLLAGGACALAIAACLLLESPLVIAMAIAAIACLAVSYRYRLSFASYLTGLFLYYPLALVLSSPLGIVDGFLVSATVVVVLSERMSFENEISPVVEATLGVDSETIDLANTLGSYHWRKLGEFVLLASIVAGASLLLGTTSQLVQVLVSSTMILMFVVFAYVRWTYGKGKKSDEEGFYAFLRRRYRRQY